MPLSLEGLGNIVLAQIDIGCVRHFGRIGGLAEVEGVAVFQSTLAEKLRFLHLVIATEIELDQVQRDAGDQPNCFELGLFIYLFCLDGI